MQMYIANALFVIECKLDLLCDSIKWHTTGTFKDSAMESSVRMCFFFGGFFFGFIFFRSLFFLSVKERRRHRQQIMRERKRFYFLFTSSNLYNHLKVSFYAFEHLTFTLFYILGSFTISKKFFIWLLHSFLSICFAFSLIFKKNVSVCEISLHKHTN